MVDCSYTKIQCKVALNKLHTPRLPFQWDLNLYRGCSHACKYCYAIYSHRYLNAENYFQQIYIKENIVETLERQLSNKRWKPAVINLGGVTDSYQPIEATVKLMPEILKLLIKYRNPATISTKSALLLRDRDLFIQLAEVSAANVAVTVTTLDANLQAKIEPGSSKASDRLNMLAAFKNTKVVTGVHLMPIIPCLTDNLENLEAVFKAARSVGAHYILAGAMYLKGPTKQNFFKFIAQTFPELVPQYREVYRTAYAPKEYRQKLAATLQWLRSRYYLHGKATDFNLLARIAQNSTVTEKTPLQLSLFES